MKRSPSGDPARGTSEIRRQVSSVERMTLEEGTMQHVSVSLASSSVPCLINGNRGGDIFATAIFYL